MIQFSNSPIDAIAQEGRELRGGGIVIPSRVDADAFDSRSFVDRENEAWVNFRATVGSLAVCAARDVNASRVGILFLLALSGR